MNEKIKELSVEAGITTNLDTEYFERDMNKWVDYYTEKFAELLVRECIKLYNDDGYQTDYEQDLKVLSHFGFKDEVEE